MKLSKVLPFLIILSLAFSAGWTPTVPAPANQTTDGWVTDPNVKQEASTQTIRAEMINVADLASASAPESAQVTPENVNHPVGLAVSPEEYAALKQQAAAGNASGSKAPDVQMDSADLGVEAPGNAPGPSAPVGPIVSFPGPTKAATGGWVPPDSNLAVGPDAIVACTNSAFIGYTKTGSQLFNIPYSSWWSSTLTGGYTFIFNPICKYDKLSNRFIMVALVQNLSPLFSRYLVSVSNNSGTSLWWNTAYDATLDGATPTSLWADFPDVGVDNNAIYITSNQYNSSNVFQYSKIRILDKAALYAGATPSWVDFWGMTNPVIGGNAFALRAAHNLKPNNIEYFTNSLSGSGSQLSVYRILNPLTTPTFEASATATTVTAYALAPDAVQPGTATLIDTGDARLLNAVMQDGYLWTAHTVTSGGATPRACFRWYQINAVSAAAIQNGIFCSTGDYFYPALTLDKQGNMGVTFSYVSSGAYATMRYTGRLTTTAPNDLEGSNGVVSGLGPHTSGRWGDYGGAAINPDGSKMWFIHEFAGDTTTTDWRTQIFSARYIAVSRWTTDFNGDSKTDVAVWRPSNGMWYVNGQFNQQWGGAGDIPVPGDYNGDGATDVVVFRPSNGFWYANGQFATQYGGAGDIPVPGDYDGNGTTDIAVFRPSNGIWYVNGQFATQYGGAGDIPVPGDYNGDGKTDVAVFRPSNGVWYVKDQSAVQYGGAGDIPVPGDYDGNGTTDKAVFRPSSGTWYIFGGTSVQYGGNGDIPVPGDYDGNGTTDIAVFRPSNGIWYVNAQFAVQYGGAGDFPLPARDTNGDGDPYQ